MIDFNRFVGSKTGTETLLAGIGSIDFVTEQLIF